MNLRQNPSKTLKQLHAFLLTSGVDAGDFAAAFAGEFSSVTDIATLLSSSSISPFSAYQTLKQIHQHQLQRRRRPTPLAVLITSLISGYGRRNDSRLALVVYGCMVSDGVVPIKHTFPLVLKCCGKFGGIMEARQLHCAAVKMSYSKDLFVQNALLYAYAVCGEYKDAGFVFDEMPVRDVVSWTGLISGYVKGGFFSEAIELFLLMDVKANVATLVSILAACSRLGCLGLGKGIHGWLVKLEGGIGLVAGNALLDMYVKGECLEEAKRIFDELPHRDIFSWTSIISGLVQCKKPRDAIETFHDMQAAGVKPDKITLSSVLSACASLGALDCGRWVHEYIVRKGIEWDVHIGTAMVDMYAKCGCLDTAKNVFREMPQKNVSSWNALLGALSMHGYGKEALMQFDEMISVGVNPNEVTFLSLLSACSHSGLVAEGQQLFELMTKFYNRTAWIEHYGCMVDMLCRAGLLGEAYELVKSMPMRPDVYIWGSLLSACKDHGSVKIFQQILSYLLEMECCNSGVYVLLSNIYARNNKWREVTKVRKLMRQRGVDKETGSSIIDVNGETHEFAVGEFKHPQKNQICEVLHNLMKQV